MVTDKEKEQRAKEAAWNIAALAGSPDLQAYRMLASKVRGLARHNSALAVWEIQDGEIYVRNRYFVINAAATLEHGMRLFLREEMTRATLEIGHIPTRLPGTDCFVWVPRHTDARFCPSDPADVTSHTRLSMGIMFGCPARIGTLVEGKEYLTLARDIESYRQQLGALAHA